MHNYKGQQITMGAKLCCSASKAQIREEPDSKAAEQLIKDFFDKHQTLQQAFDYKKLHMKYGSIKKTSLMDYPYGVYIGNIIEEARYGSGMMLFSTGMYYEGDWKGDKMTGKGFFCFNNGDHYDGEWRDCLPNGKGVFVRNQPFWKYEGAWKNGKQHGRGKQYFHDDSYFEGEFKEGQRDGEGKFTNSDGRLYKGQFKNGQPDGFCLACDTHYLYEGEWKDGKQSGTGKSEWYDETKQKVEAVYIGEYQEGVKHGFGEYRFKDTIYKGKWENGEMRNKGVVVHNSEGKNGRQ